MYHNTTNADAGQLQLFEEKIASQDEKIFQWFKRNPFAEVTPFRLQKIMRLDRVPITSIRRALCNLTERGLLEKTKQEIEIYGVKNFCWKLKSKTA